MSLIAQEESAEQTTEAPAEQAAEAPVSDRPEWLPEKFKTPEDLASSYKELASKLGSKEEDLRKAIVEELQADAFKDRPETAGDYQLPESIDPESAVDSELLNWWSNHAFENGYSQEEFQQGIEMYAQAMMQSQPDLEAEAKKLGDNAADRIQAASMFANKFFPEAALPAIERMCESHEGILALEAIQEALKDSGYAGNTEPTAGTSEAELREMMNDPRYWKDRDPHYIKQVTDGFERLYRS